MVTAEQFRALAAQQTRARTRGRKAVNQRLTPPNGLSRLHLPVPDPVEDPTLTLDALGPPLAAFIVAGTPVTMGSKEYKGHGLKRTKSGKLARIPILENEDAAGLKAWQKAVRDTALRELGPAWVPLDGAVILDEVYTVPRIASAAKTLAEYPTGRKDLDKVDRGTHDALKGNLWKDDCLHVGHRRHRAFYTGHPDPDVLPFAGVVLRAWVLPRVPLAQLRDGAGQ